MVWRWVYPVVPEPMPREHFEGMVKLAYGADFTAPDPEDWRPFGGPRGTLAGESPSATLRIYPTAKS